jgi:hypothetical protein
MSGRAGTNDGGAKGWLVNNFEKILLGVAGLLVLVFVYFGSRHKPIEENLAPEKLQQKASAAMNHIKDPATWNSAASKRFSGDADYDKRATQDVASINLADYELMKPWDPILEPLLSLRKDPELFNVEKLEARPGIAALAVASTGRKSSSSGFRGTRRGDDDPAAPPLRADQTTEFEKFIRTPANAEVKGKFFVSVTGLVPYKKQQVEYLRCFADAAGYDPSRDTPHYFWFYLQRAEVADDGTYVDQVDEEGNTVKWITIRKYQSIADLRKTWAPVTTPDYVDPAYTDEIFTMPLPPLLATDLSKYARHSEIPQLKTEAELAAEQEAAVEETETEGPLGPGGPGPGGSTPGDEEPTLKQGEEAGVEEIDAEYLMFRFFDFDVRHDRKYQYQVGLLLHDPNDPKEVSGGSGKDSTGGWLRPQDADLDQSVILRLTKRREAERSQKRDIYWRETGDDADQVKDTWSEPSNTVSFPALDLTLLADVVGDDTYGPYEIRRAERFANIMRVVWDSAEAAWVPGLATELRRGSMIDFSTDAWVLDAGSLSVRSVPSYVFDRGGLVVDVRGGEDLPKPPGRRRNFTQLVSPGEVLIMTDDGGLIVCDEVDNAKQYRKHFFGSLVEYEEEDERGLGDDEPDLMEGPGDDSRFFE